MNSLFTLPTVSRLLGGLALLAAFGHGAQAQTINPVSSQTICNNAVTSAVNFSGATGAVYTWTNSVPSIGLAATGSGNIPSFTVTNTGTASVTANINVVPVYSGTVNTQTYNYSGSIVSFTVPTGVTTLTMTAKGAQGGNATSDGPASGGLGASITALYNVTPGHVLRILVGEQPAGGANAGGGGGGTFVWDQSASNTLLVAAGGGGGGATTAFGCACPRNGVNATLTLAGASGGGGLGGAGTGGNGGTAVPGASNGAYSGGGAGWLSDGVIPTSNSGCPQAGTTAKTALNGGNGGNSAGGPWGNSINGYGGFGGGGGSMGFCGGQGAGGGGGGYSGGAGANFTPSPNASFGGGGGGSYTSGTGATAVVNNTGSGQVALSYYVAGPIYGASTSFNYVANPTPIGTASPSSTTICSGQGHTINLSSSVPGSTYSWNIVLASGSLGAPNPFSGTSAAITNTYAGNAVFSYTAVAIANGCQGPVFSSSVTLNPLPTVGSTASNSVICSGDPVTLTGTGTASTYTWSGGITNGVPFSPLGTNTYTVTGTSSNGCSRTAVRTVSVNPTPIVSVNSGSICAGSTFTMIPSGADTYTYSSGSATVIPAAGANTYTVTGTSVDGCVSSAVLSIVTGYTLPVISVNSGSICAGKTFTMNPSGAATYTYSNGSNTVAPPVGSYTYAVTGTNANGCVSASAAVSSLTVQALPVISVNSGSICAGKTFTMNPSGAATYTYSNGSGTVTPSAGTHTYAVTGTNANGCVSATAAVATVTVNALPVVSVNSGSVCAGQIFTMNPSGAVTYTYSSGTNTVIPSVGTHTYAVTGTNANGCVSAPAIASATAIVLPVISVNSGSICVGQTFTITPSGAATYTYSNGTNTVNPSVGTSTYAVTGTSAGGCVSAAAAIASLTVNALPVISVNSGSICLGQAFIMTPAGADTYTFSNGSNTVIPAANDSYSVTGTDANGCVSATAAIASVTVHTLPVISVNGGSICLGQTFTLVPTGADTYTFSGGSATVSPTSTDSYSVTGTDANGCVSATAAIASVSVHTLPVISVNSGSICLGQTFTLVPTGADTYTFSSGSATVSPTSTDSYSVTGTDINGCVSASAAVSTVTVNLPPTVGLSSDHITLCAGETAVLSASGASTYVWSTSATTESISVSPASTTVYSVTGTDANGCSTSVSYTQTVSPCTGIEEVNGGGLSMVVYPNPNNGVFTIEVAERVSVEMLDVLGKTVLTTELSEGKHQLSIDQQGNGFYFLNVTGKDQRRTFRMIKQ